MNSLAEFEKVVEVIFNYDLREDMKLAKVKGLIVIGAQDGVLPAAMKEISAGYGMETECVVN